MKTKYRSKEYTFGQLKNDIIMPDFQRSLVWSKEQKKEFIQNAIEGNPFGVLLLYDDLKTGKLTVIDGLQRFTTLRKYDENPFLFFDITADAYPEIKNVFKIIKEVYDGDSEDNIMENILGAIKKIVSSHKNIRDSKFPDIVTEEIIKVYASLKGTKYDNMIYRQMVGLWDSIKKYIEIDSLLVPAITFHGNESDLPLIFESLNRGGTKLSKYEVYASSWKNTVLIGVEKDITKRVEKRYKSIMEQTELEIEGYNEGSIIAEGKVSLYEYAFALGKIIKDENKILTAVKTSKADDAVESLGFSTLNTFIGMHMKEMPKLNKKIHGGISPSHLTRFKKVILTVYQEVEEILAPYVRKFNKFIEAQVLSVVYTWFKLNYDFDADTLVATRKVADEKMLNRFKKHMPYRFLNDILRSTWSGHGDNTLFDIMTSSLENNRYLLPIEQELWKNHLDEWMDQQMKSPLKSFTADIKLFYAYILHTLGKSPLEDYSIQHVIPKKTVLDIPAMVPISPLGNYYLLPVQFKEYKNSILYEKLGEHRIDFVYPSKDSLMFAIEKNINENTYLDFILKRNNNLIEIFLDSLPIY